MENPPLEYQSKEFIKQTHKGGSILQKMLNINDDEKGEFSVDEYRNAIHNERTKRQQCIRANNDEHKLRRELRLINAIIDPALIDKKSTLKQEIQSRLAMSSKYICDMQDKLIEHPLVEKKSTLKQEIQYRLAESNKYISNASNDIREMQEKLKEHVMAERMRQSVATTIRKKNNKLFEMREIAKNNGPNNNNANVDNWNVNNINIENDDDTNRIKRIIITKRRGRMADEIVNATL